MTLAADTATKAWAVTRLDAEPVSLLGGWLVLTEGRNPGAAFGLGTSFTPVISLIAVAALVGIALALRQPRSTGMVLALGLLAGGAAGNLVDRVFRSPGPLRGHVVDWIDIGSWPTFNLADSAIVVGALLLVLVSTREPARSGRGPGRAVQ